MVRNVNPVTDPELLKRLNGQSGTVSTGNAPTGAVSDPELIARLNGQSGMQAQEPEQPKQSGGFMDELSRQAGLTGRALVGGAAQLVEPFTEPVRYLMNKALPGNPVGNIETAADEVMTKIGVPEPQGGVEEGVQDVGRFMTSAGFGFGGANSVEKGVQNALGLATKAPKPTVPTTDQLKELANTAYKAADDAGLVVHPGSFKNFVTRVEGITKSAGIDKDIHPKASAAIRRLKEAAESGDPIKLEDMEILRRVVNGARSSADKSERRMGGIITEELDNYLARMGSNDVIAGDAQAASAALKNARDLWSRMSKSKAIEDAIEVAYINSGQFSGSGFENALRTQFRQIARNPKRMRGFSAEEQEAIKKVATGGPLDNAFRYLGKLAPTGIVSGTMGGGIGYTIGGPAGAVAVPLAGAASRRIATKMTQKNVENLSELVRNGGAIPKDTPEWLLPWLSGGIFGTDTQSP